MGVTMVGTLPGIMGNNRWNSGTVGGGMAETMCTMRNTDRNNGNKGRNNREQRQEQREQ